MDYHSIQILSHIFGFKKHTYADMHYIIPHFEQNLSSLAPEQPHTEQNILVNVLWLSTNTRFTALPALEEWRDLQPRVIN
jgi:hypothetical protein